MCTHKINEAPYRERENGQWAGVFTGAYEAPAELCRKRKQKPQANVSVCAPASVPHTLEVDLEMYNGCVPKSGRYPGHVCPRFLLPHKGVRADTLKSEMKKLYTQQIADVNGKA